MNASLPDRPRILSPDKAVPTSGSELQLVSFSSDTRTYTISRFWKRIFQTSLECGDENELTQSVKIGLSQSITAEVASSLKLTVGQLVGELSSKLSGTSKSEWEQTVTQKHKVSAPKCGAIVFAQWQLIEKYEIQNRRARWLRSADVTTKTLLNPLEEFKPDRLFYPNPQCCPEETRPRPKRISSEIPGVIGRYGGAHIGRR